MGTFSNPFEQRSRASRSRVSHAGGFTLIEVLIVMAIIGILAAIALPSYTDYVIRGALPEATTRLSDVRARMEQFYLDNRTYAGTGGCGISPATIVASGDLFTYTCTATATTYTYVATGNGSSKVNGFRYSIDQNGVQQTVALPATWVGSLTLPVQRWVIRKGG